jgi:hypothetical protein
VVAKLQRDGQLSATAADAIVSNRPRARIAVLTADCLPILAASEGGEVVAAIHAGWRGLAAGVVEAGIAAIREWAPRDALVRAVIGPYIGACCYEVDGPVLAALAERFGAEVWDSGLETRRGHRQIDLGQWAEAALAHAGVTSKNRGRISNGCTFCHAERFHSYRRDGDRAGRLLHYIAAGAV